MSAMLYVRPRALRPGDRIALVAPASPLPFAQVEAGADELRSLGFEPFVHPSVTARDGYVAGDAATRAAALLEVVRAPDVRAILAIRGGYGSAELLPYLSPDELRRAAKPLIGYSDITALLTLMTQQAGVVSFHGPMIDRRLAAGPAGYDRDTFMRLLCEPVALGEVPTDDARVMQTGRATGPLVGGTLTQLVSLLGTPWAFDPPEGAILFIDEANERPYRLDRMLLQLRLAGILDRVQGVIFNELPGCDDADGCPTSEAAVRRALAGVRGPMVIGVASGHTSRPMLTLPLGVRVTLHASDAVHLTIDAPAVQ